MNPAPGAGAGSASGPHDGSPSAAAAAALRGASLAFSKKAPATPPPRKDNGALTAATASASRSRSPASRPGNTPPSTHQYATNSLAPQDTGSTVSEADIGNYFRNGHFHSQQASHTSTGLGAVSSKLQQLHPHKHGSPHQRGHSTSAVTGIDPASASFIAATLAASRSASPSPKARSPPAIDNAGNEVVDSGSLAPTGSLISMFERSKSPPTTAVKYGNAEQSKRMAPRRLSADMLDASRSMQALPRMDQKPRLRPVTKRILSDKPEQRGPAPVAEARQRPKLFAGLPAIEPAAADSTSQIKARKLELINLGSKPRPEPKLQSLPQARKAPPVVESDTSARPSPLPPAPRGRDVDLMKVSGQAKNRPRAQSLSEESPERAEPMLVRSSTIKPKVKPKPKPKPLSPKPIVSTSTTEVLSPKPVRISSLRSTKGPQISVHSPPRLKGRKESAESQEITTARRPPTPPKPRGSDRSTSEPANQRPVARKVDRKDRGTPTRRPTMGAESRPRSASSASTNDTFVSASSVQSPSRLSPPKLPSRPRLSTSGPPSPTHDIRRIRSANSSTSNLPLNALTNAIMAGSLASARLTPHHTGSSLPPPPSLTPVRHNSPRMLQTLRQPRPSDEDDNSDRHKKGHLRKLHTGKHAHHEGSRKKWREEITPRERKRYEAVWASNRGSLIPAYLVDQDGRRGEASEYVVNIVVRDIWRRSRLPLDELAEVWALVDRDGKGALSRQAFVAGMWLIDQRLRGRKIPSKVTDSVWGSANGVRIRGPKVR